MSKAPQWLNLEQILKRADLLRLIEHMVQEDRDSAGGRTTLDSRFKGEVLWLALKALREARKALHTAETAAWENGGAAVEAGVLEVCRTFNSMGHARLSQFAETRRKQRRLAQPETYTSAT